jgi:cholesterol oxidase
MSVERLLRVLDAVGIEATGREAAEAIWLAVRIAERTGPAASAPSAPERAAGEPAPTAPVTAAPPPVEETAERPRPPQGDRATLYSLGQAATAAGPARRDAVTVRAPAVPALPGGRDILRALRPLKRRVPSRHDFVLDESATADRVAAERLVLPVMSPADGRWLSVALVADAGPSMVIWRSLVAELRILLERLGAFRDVRTWHLHAAPDGTVGIHPRAVLDGPPRSPRELIDPSGRQAVLVVSDCVDEKWRDGAADDLLDAWGRTGPLAILQPLPQRLWRRSGAAPLLARIHATAPGLPNSRLLVVPDERMPDARPHPGLAVPILEIEPDWLAPWARLIAGTAYGGMDGAVMLSRPGTRRPPAAPDGESPSPYERVLAFRAAASPEAYRLAGHLAAAPLTLPVMRLVQHVMLPATRPSHLAEVFVGGLLRVADETPVADPELIEYDFIDGVRDVLLGTIRRSDAMRVFDEVSAYVTAHMGRSRDTAALVDVPAGTGDRSVGDDRPFATVPRQVIERLGDPLPRRDVPREPMPSARPVGTTSTEHADVVVVGSGFGGSVAAYRLAEAGLSVVVLERGRDYPPGSFARTPAEMSRAFWDPSAGLYGLFDTWSFRGFDSIVSSGLGGGSLIDANVLMRKDEHWFVHEALPGGGYESWPVTRADLDPHYEAVEKMLGANPYPLEHRAYAATPKTRAMQAAAAELGLDWRLPPLAVSFAPDAGSEPGVGLPLATPWYGNLHGVPRTTCRLCGECNIGCNDGSKNTLDHTYLSAAKHHGADLRTLHEVTAIRPRVAGGYEVDVVQHDPKVKVRKPPAKTISCDRLVLAAGTYGTSYLLLRNRARFPGLSGALGSRFSGNGDLLTFLRRVKGDDRVHPLDASRGPVITSAIRLPDERDGHGDAGRGAYIEDGGYPSFVNWMVEDTDIGRELGRIVRVAFERFRAFISNAPDTRTSRELSELIGDGALSMSSLPLLGMGRDVPDGVLRLRGGMLDIDWSAETSTVHFERLRVTMRRIAHVLGAAPSDQPIRFRKEVLTIHPSGGAPIGGHPGEGVCDPYGEVYGFPGLYIADGAALPGPVGANPSLTIAALADRMCTRMLEGRSERSGAARPSAQGSGRTTLSFTEEMKGFYAEGETAPEPGERAGREREQTLQYRLTITVDDVGRFLAEPGYTARADGWIAGAGIGECEIQQGWFDLFAPGDAPDRRLARYRLHFTDDTGRARTFSGWKDINHRSAQSSWPGATTLYFRLLEGHVPDGEDEEAANTGAGILRLDAAAFARQLTTFRTSGPEGAPALELFTAFYLGELTDRPMT